jgi:hypothetical protein
LYAFLLPPRFVPHVPKWESNTKMWECTGFVCLRIGSFGAICIHCNKPLGPIKKWGISLAAERIIFFKNDSTVRS